MTVLSTGIGCDNIDIVVNELDAIFNIDLKTREIKKDLTSLNLIRLGTCGAIREDIPVDSIIVSDYGLGLDNLMSFYDDNVEFYDNAKKRDVNNYLNDYDGALVNSAMLSKYNPYIVECDSSLKNIFNDFHHGITATSPGFYGPQNRNLRIKNNTKNLIDSLKSIKFKNSKVLNFEMETSALYGLAKLSGHKALTLCTVVANRETKEFTKDSEKSVDNMIKMFLERII